MQYAEISVRIGVFCEVCVVWNVMPRSVIYIRRQSFEMPHSWWQTTHRRFPEDESIIFKPKFRFVIN